MQDYPSEQARIVLREMADASCLDLVQKDVACTGVALWVGYSCAEEGPAGASASRRLGAPTDSVSYTHLDVYKRQMLRLMQPWLPYQV